MSGLRIGVMLRHLGQHGGGVSVYTQNLLREFARLESPHEFVFLYRDPALIGRFAGSGHIREVAARAPCALLWDQVAAPRLARRERVDVLFNPKYSIPLRCELPRVWVCHGLDWYAMPWGSRWRDRLNHHHLIPRYARSAARILCVSDSARAHLHEYLGVSPRVTETVRLGVDDAFREPLPRTDLAAVSRANRLPPRFFLYCGQIYPPKNFGRLIRAYAQVGPRLGFHLVVAGEHRWLAAQEIAEIERLDIAQWVHWLGWVDRKTLPALYRLARALLLPSLYEGCPIPLLEAMASGCPVVTADGHGCAEIGGDAAILVDPHDVESIRAGIRRAATDLPLCRSCSARGIERSRRFSWKRCARETVAALERAAAA